MLEGGEGVFLVVTIDVMTVVVFLRGAGFGCSWWGSASVGLGGLMFIVWVAWIASELDQDGGIKVCVVQSRLLFGTCGGILNG